MKIFNTDIRTLIHLLLPIQLRKDTTLLDACIGALNYVKEQLLKLRSDLFCSIALTGQVYALEKMLNDKYDKTLRRIYITNGTFREQVYIFQHKENSPIFIHKQDEDIKYLYNFDEIGSVSGDFIVNVPTSISASTNEISVMIDIYKLATKTYTIKRF